MSLSALTAELREFIRRLKLAGDDQRQMKRDLLAIANALRDADGEGGGGRFVSLSLRATCRAGRLTSDSLGTYRAAPAGLVVHVYDHASGTFLLDLAPVRDDARASFFIPTGTVELDFLAVPPSVRFQTPTLFDPGAFTVNAGTTAISTQALSGGSLSPASGYHYTGLTDLPAADGLLLDDSVRGVVGLSFPNNVGAGGTFWQATSGVNVWRYTLPSALTDTVLSITVSGVPQAYHLADITSLTPPSDTGPVKFSVTFAVAGGTVTVYEP